MSQNHWHTRSSQKSWSEKETPTEQQRPATPECMTNHAKSESKMLFRHIIFAFHISKHLNFAKWLQVLCYFSNSNCISCVAPPLLREAACLSPHQLPRPNVVSNLWKQSLPPCPQREPWGSSSNSTKIIFLCQTIEINFPENACNHWASSDLQLHDGKSLHLSLHSTEGRRLFSSKLCNGNYVKTTHLLLVISLHTDLQHPASKVKCSSSKSIFK